ncbi:MAG: ATP-binding protein, partial [Sulfurimonas sp.]|nr:ATP-binding protein [Sulfurimonas sp.]
MLEHSTLYQLRGKKNLLAFSGGVDSSALFFLLLGENIEFDIAIVNYKQRAQSE